MLHPEIDCEVNIVILLHKQPALTKFCFRQCISFISLAGMVLKEVAQSISYLQVVVLTISYFLFLYFILGYVFQQCCHFLERKGLLHKIYNVKSRPGQQRSEKLHSLSSIVVFGFSGLPIILLYQHKLIDFLPDTLWNTLTGLFLLTLWNELHFFLVHRMMHIPFMMKHIHVVHHRSAVPSVYSVYSFHWVEALLLSTVPLSALPFFNLSILTIAIFPLISILFNFSGHCNYRFGNGKGNRWKIFGTRHAEHHQKGKKNYGFVLPVFDDITK